MPGSQKILIKGMLCNRCIELVRGELSRIGIVLDDISLGEVTVSASASQINRQQVIEQLAPLGFALVEDRVGKTVEVIKEMVAEVYSGHYDFPDKFRFSKLVSARLLKDYDAISTLFSTAEGKTLEKYIIDFRIDKIKEWLVYTEESLSDISFRLGFSSVAHLSRQFKQHTGLNPSYFKQVRKEKMQATG